MPAVLLDVPTTFAQHSRLHKLLLQFTANYSDLRFHDKSYGICKTSYYVQGYISKLQLISGCSRREEESVFLDETRHFLQNVL